MHPMPVVPTLYTKQALSLVAVRRPSVAALAGRIKAVLPRQSSRPPASQQRARARVPRPPWACTLARPVRARSCRARITFLPARPYPA